ncbi:MAG: HAMP domain-containing histidine kinase [Oscillospiraceae bacterium]|nr:HAMP domain-containing histidine kinase [Oscillospiraceae bacterium]
MTKVGGITRRWIKNILSVIIALVIVVAASACFLIKNYYYSSVESTLESSSSDLTTTFFNIYGGSTDEGFAIAGREFIETFSRKDMFEVWIVDRLGNVILSSSGFEIADGQEMPDFAEAMASGTGKATWTGKLNYTGEKVMAMTATVTNTNGSIAGAIRYIVSLEDIDHQIGIASSIIIVLALIIIALSTILGLLFTRSIVIPLRDIGAVAGKVADGDLNVRIDNYKYDDEISELSEKINYMIEELNAADRMKNDFVSTVSHELRTPLTSIKGWGETLLQVGDTDPALTKRGMSVIISEAARLSGMVEELLDFSKIQGNRLNLQLKKIDVLAELDETVFTFKERAIKDGVEIIYNAPELPAPMEADEDRIRQVFVNIFDNAIKYNYHGGRVIVLAQIVNPTTLEISISDTGRGISPENLPKVKEKFFKADTTISGSGIGLAVADEIVKLHGGTLNIDSILNEGTTVTITLPIKAVTYLDERGVQNEEE